jgi:lipid A 3-O-deacylase
LPIPSTTGSTPNRRPPGRAAAVRLALAAVCLLAAPRFVAAAEWALYAGAFDVGTGDEVAEAGVEARFRLFELPLGAFELPLEPAAGVMANADGGGYLYGSLRIPLHELWNGSERPAEPPRWRVVPFTGAGLYEAGDGKDLGGAVEFRSGLEVAVRAGDRWWVGLSYYHLSNAVLYDRNPGEESLVLVVSRR